ncbi:MAG: type II secretion system GspH family protein, partial [Planctomycetes bacterium]|nr:type II secretion system GspH family protein [Planctomycetota bacterium]
MTRGFTLIELLIVVGIIALVAGMIAGSMTRRGEDAEVAKAAQQLAWDLRRARALAIQTGGVHGIAINMPATTGGAPSNETGQHYYRMFGPSPKIVGGLAQNSIPVADYLESDKTASRPNPFRVLTMGELRRAIAACWRGDPVYLPRNKVRFLALADTDEGIGSSRTPNGNPSYPANYPRPWFGYYAGGTWYPWGQGYDIRADDHDYLIAFLPNGAAIVPEFMRNRRYYQEPNCKNKPDMSRDDGMSAADYPKPSEIRAFTQPEAHERPAWECWWDIPEVAHFTRHTGGWFVTLAT